MAHYLIFVVIILANSIKINIHNILNGVKKLLERTQLLSACGEHHPPLLVKGKDVKRLLSVLALHGHQGQVVGEGEHLGSLPLVVLCRPLRGKERVRVIVQTKCR